MPRAAARGARIGALGCMLIVGGGTLLSARASGDAPLRVTVWGAASTNAAFGGMTYGGQAPLSGALISEQREVDVAANGEFRIAGVAATIDPASVQLRDLTEPGASILEQRFVPGATTPTEMLARRIGDPVTIVTTKGDVVGVLRAIDDATVVVEVGTGEQRRLSVMRRDGYVLDLRVPIGITDRPSLVWRIATKRPGKHTVELTYRARGISWTADYLAVLDEPGKTISFSAWATVKNRTGVTFDRAALTLVGGGATDTAPGSGLRPPRAELRFTTPAAVKLGAGESIQVELVPARTAASVRPVITYEAMPDPSAAYQEDPALECALHSTSTATEGRAGRAVELDLSPLTRLPDGRVRLLQRKAGRLDVVRDDALHSAAGIARIELAPTPEITGVRKVVTCAADEVAQTIHEKIEVRVENTGKQAADVVIREFAWRWPVWRLESESKQSLRTGAQAHEYRVRVPARGSQTVTYSVVYAW